MPLPTDPYEDIFQAAAQEWNVDPTLLKALAMQESLNPKTGQLNPRAVSPAGALGLMQIMPGTARDLGMKDPYDPAESIFAGAKYLSQGLDAEGTPEGALLFYHGGPGWRQKYGDESRKYVPGVLGYYRALTAAQKAQQPAQPAPQATANGP